jgi:hypothetical protein
MRLALVVLVTALAGCVTAASGPFFVGVTPATTGKCVLYYYYPENPEITSLASIILAIDDQEDWRVFMGEYARRELPCGPHDVELVQRYPSSWWIPHYFMRGRIDLQPDVPAFLGIHQQQATDRPFAQWGFARTETYWHFYRPDEATALVELQKTQAVDWNDDLFKDSKPR